MNNTLKTIGNLILLLIAPVTLWFDGHMRAKENLAINVKTEEISKKLLGYVDREAVQAEVYASFFSSSIMADPLGNIIAATPGAAKMFGYTVDELKKMRINDLMPERYKLPHNEKYAKRMQEEYNPEKVVTVPKCYGLRKDKTEFPVEVRTRLIKPDDNLISIARFVELKNLEVVKPESIKKAG